MGKRSAIFGWMHSFFKQFYGSVSKSDYAALRLGFIMTHCKQNPKFNFHKYMIRALEDDFKTVVGISWYLWVFVVIFLFLNVNGWHTYFWIAFIPFVVSWIFTKPFARSNLNFKKSHSNKTVTPSIPIYVTRFFFLVRPQKVDTFPYLANV
uniref:Putative ovule protein n=1 Tax=Solanum chacoense TaxID=4108 RepID=A0A0V0IEM7_SOLCH